MLNEPVIELVPGPNQFPPRGVAGSKKEPEFWQTVALAIAPNCGSTTKPYGLKQLS